MEIKLGPCHQDLTPAKGSISSDHHLGVRMSVYDIEGSIAVRGYYGTWNCMRKENSVRSDDEHMVLSGD